jgi:glycine cleavage system H protein
MNTPKNLKYAQTHEWIALNDDNTATVGITDYAQNKLGSLVFVNLPMEGDSLTCGDAFCDVESVKAVSDINAPIDGTVIEVNEALMDNPGAINEDPYGAWLVKVTVEGGGDELMDADAYAAFCSREE